MRYRVDDERSAQRFTPRRKGSIWSAINVAKVATLTEQGRMRPAGIAAFEARTPEKTGDLRVRAGRRGVHGRRDAPGSRRERGGLGRLGAPAAVVSQGRDALGDERQAPRDARAAPGVAHRRLRRRAQAERPDAARRALVTDDELCRLAEADYLAYIDTFAETPGVDGPRPWAVSASAGRRSTTTTSTASSARTSIPRRRRPIRRRHRPLRGARPGLPLGDLPVRHARGPRRTPGGRLVRSTPAARR